MSDVLIKADNVSKRFCRDFKRSLLYGLNDSIRDLIPLPGKGIITGPKALTLRKHEFWALKDVSFELRRGECLGLIGHNGAGKTTLLKMLNGLIKPDGGRIEMHGRIGALIALGAGFNPVLTGRENIYVNGSVLGLRQSEIDEKFDEIIEFSEMEDFIDTPVQSYSSGMKVRLGFAIASTIQPDVLLLDEVLAVGDAHFRAKCLLKLSNLLSNSAVIFVSHQASQIQKICDRVLWLRRGNVVGMGSTEDYLSEYAKESYQDVGSDHLRPEAYSEPHLTFKGVEPANASLSWGSDFDLSIKVFSKIPVKVDGIRIGIIDQSGTIVAQSSINQLAGIPANQDFEFNIRLKNLRLVNGNYTANVAMVGSNGKILVLRVVNAFRFNMAGSGFGAAAYQIDGEHCGSNQMS